MESHADWWTIDDRKELRAVLEKGEPLRGLVVQRVNLTGMEEAFDGAKVDGAVFLGCDLPDGGLGCRLLAGGALLFPQFNDLPYSPYRSELYSREELMEGWSEEADASLDLRIYEHFSKNGRSSPSVVEALAQRVHDHSIDAALRRLLAGENGEAKKVVGIMGGHGVARTDPFFAKVVEIAAGLARRGLMVASGGGPGVMEAANLGAYLCDASSSEVAWALETLEKAPKYTDPGYVAAAQVVLERFPEGGESLAIPTWFYGHEPSNMFSPYIAKYFSNSIREDGLLAIAQHGVLYAPGSAGTIQEVFMDACQNHYRTYDFESPMVFLGREHYVEKSGVYDTLKTLAGDKPYADLMLASDEADEIIEFIAGFEPQQGNE